MAIDTGILTNFGLYVAIAIVFSILALGFNIQWGYTGLFNAGIAGFYLIGAYVAAIALTAPQPPQKIGDIIIVPGHWGGFQLPFVAAVLLAMIASATAAALVAIPTLRLRADYLAIATIAFAEVLRNFTINLESFTGGAIGISFIPRPVVFNPPNLFLTIMSLVAIGGGILLMLLLVLQFMFESAWGRVLRATREDEEATMALGKDTFSYKLQAFAIGGALMGLAGALSAVILAYIEPTGSFAPGVTFSVWVMVIVGGSGNNRGAILGAFLIYGLEWASVQLKDFAPAALKDQIFYIRFMIIGILLILLVLFRPEGILREKKRALR
jgi:branched-chain amino acid transport system permease protein